MSATDVRYPGGGLPEKRFPGGGVPEKRFPGGGVPQGGQPSGASRERTWVKLTILLILLASLTWVLMLTVQYCRTGWPLQNLPGLSGVLGVTPQVHYSDSFYGADGLDRPFGAAVSNSGDRIYVSEIGGDQRILVFSRSGEEIGSFIPPDSVQVGSVPLYLAVGPDDHVYVSDRRSRSVHIFNPDGESVGTFEPQSVPAEEWFPMGLAFDAEGSLYVTDVTPEKHRVMVFDSSGALKLEFGSEGTEEGQFRYPNGIAVDGRGHIYVADGNNGRLQVFDVQGRFLYQIFRGFGEGSLSLPRGVAIDGEDRLYVADTSAHTIRVYDISGDGADFLYDFGSRGVGDGQFRFPNGIAVDASSRLYVTDKENGRIQIWSYQR